MDRHALDVLEYDKIIKMLMECTVSKPANKLAGKVRPLVSPKKVIEKLKETSDAVQYMVRKGKPHLSGVSDMSEFLNKAEKGGTLLPGELLKVADLLFTCRSFTEYFEDKNPEETNSIYTLYRNIERNDALEREIKRIIINEYELADEASPELYSIRKSINRTKDELKSGLERMIRSPQYVKFIQEPLVTVRNDRYVLPVKSGFKSEIKGIVHDTSASGSTVFIEPAFSVEANNKIRELTVQEKKEIERILKVLTIRVLDFGEELSNNVYNATHIDFAFAKADLSLKMDACNPQINDKFHIYINDGRHPLLDKETVVPLNMEVGDKFKILIITGPNTGGKTVALKTCGLFCLMAQAGLHVPARHGTILPIFKNVFCDIGDEQSIEQSLSTFSSHMKNIIQIVKNADSQSLVLLDELGAGTDPEEGTALAMSVLDGLLESKCTVLATTHYSDLKLYALKNENMENASCEFDIESLKPTYKLIMGVPGESNALAICKRLGLPDDYIQKARDYLHNDDIKFEEILHNIHKNKARSDRERHQAQILTKEIENLKSELEEERKKLLIEKEKMLNKAKDEAKRVVAAAKEETRIIIEQMKKIELENSYGKKLNEVNDLRREINQLDGKLFGQDIANEYDSLIKPDIEHERKMLPGDMVKILKLNQTGTLVTAPDDDGKVIVQAGIMKVTLTVDDIVPVKEQKVRFTPGSSVVTGIKRPDHVSLEVDVRGNTLNEAIETIEKYLDNVILAGLHEVSIIHGKGTGALRAGIQEYLKNNPRVENFRNGKQGEGDFGVTVVQV